MAVPGSSDSTRLCARNIPVRRTTAERLPWLNGKAHRAPKVSVDGQNSASMASQQGTSCDGQSSAVESPSPNVRPSNRKPSITTASNPELAAKPSVRKKTLSPTAVSVAGSSPSPVTRHRLSQARRTSLATNTLSPSKPARRPSISQSHGPQKRLSVVQFKEDTDEIGSNSRHNVRPRADSLAPIPDHLEQSTSPESIRVTFQGDEESASTPPPVVSRVQMSPTQPVPARTAFGRVANRRINNAVDDLEDMVQEAAEVAEDAHDQDQVEEIYGIIEGARDALQVAISMTSLPICVMSLVNIKVLYRTIGPTQTGPIERMTGPRHRVVKTRKMSRNWEHEAIYSYQSLFNLLHENTLISFFDLSAEMSLAVDHADELLTTSDFINTIIAVAVTEAMNMQADSRLDLSRQIQVTANSTLLTKMKKCCLTHMESNLQFENKHIITFSLRRNHRRQPIARNWSTGKKRVTATIACINTALLGIIVGIYAGEVPRIQYSLADERHIAIIGNAVLYAGLAISTFFAWTLPLLHGRKPYILTALAIALPLQFPQAIVVSGYRNKDAKYRVGLMVSRAVSGLVLGFANVNYITALLDLFGASLQSKNPHQEFVVVNDVRRHGGGMGMWLGIWSWCWIDLLPWDSRWAQRLSSI
ncbi:hypothetical protein P3342_013524 [Pyrenophora teres f. teres]|nr:hypothetical protein P3342_013524 [Pyrenophora teres f. teres]